MHLLWVRVTEVGGTAWSAISKKGSNLTDLETRKHSDLQELNSATYSHLTADQVTGLTTGQATTLHTHLPTPNETDFSLVSFPVSSTLGPMTPAPTLQNLMSYEWSAGVVDGVLLTDNGNGTISLSSGRATIRATNVPSSNLYGVGVLAQANIALTDNALNYVYLDYNAGVPAIFVSLSEAALDGMVKVVLYEVHRLGTVLHYIDRRDRTVDTVRKADQLFSGFQKFIHYNGGSVLGANALALTCTAGTFSRGVQPVTHVAFDTSVAGTANANVFDLWYRNGAGGWTPTPASKLVNTTLYDNNTGTPVVMTNNTFGVTWVYIVNDNPSELHAVMGQAQYNKLSDAIVAQPPSILPTLLGAFGVLIGMVAYAKSNIVFDQILSVFSASFSPSLATVHNSLSGLQGGTIDEYYHLTAADVTRLANTSGTNTGDQSLAGYAPLANPTFTGVPAAPTAAVGTNTTQLATTAFVLANAGSGAFPAGTRMLFQQTAAPTGWTKDTTAALNDTALRIVTGAVGSGGSVAFSTAAYTPPNGTLSAASHILSTAEMPSHSHSVSFLDLGGAGTTGTYAVSAQIGDPTTPSTNATGGGGGHTHALTGALGSISLALKYNDVIIATKN